MEPTRQPLRLSYTIITKVKTVELRKRHIKSWKNEQTNVVESKYEDIGWFVQFEGSWEGLFFGMDKPDFTTGDEVKITFTQVSSDAS